MPTSPLSVVIQHLMADVGPDGGGMTDGELLNRFLRSRDDALAALVRRHAPMVWGVCCRLLHNHQDAEDAFQATFLVLVRKAADVPGQAVANWLYGVARQTAVRLRATRALRRRRETQVVNMPEPAVAEVRDADWQAVLDEELSRLPEHYRGVLVLCELEGMTRKEAARQLGIPEGSVASRLARARALLAKRLTRRGVVFSGGSVAAVLSAGSASASAPPALVASTIRAASLLAAGKVAATGVISARVAALTDGVLRAMFLAKLKTVSCVLALAVLVGLGGVALVPGGGRLPAAGAAPPPQKGGDVKPDREAEKLVRQLGSESFAEREAAQKALTNMGARAAASVRAKMGDADLEVARRCARIWPRLWQAELARPDADRLAGYSHPLWARFREAAGDDPGSRTLFAEMVADFNRFSRLEAVEADPKKAGAAYAAELKQRAEALERGIQEAMAAAGKRGGGIVPAASATPTRSEFVTLLFLGTYPATARDESAGDTHHNVFALALRTANPPALRRLFAKWLATRTHPHPIATGLSQAMYHHLPEVVPLAVAHAANDKLAPGARGFALLVVGLYGTPAHLPLFKKAFVDSRMFHTTSYRSEKGQDRPIQVQVADAAIGSALWIYGQRAADFGFPIAALLKNHPETLVKYGLLGFFDNDTRQAAHKKAMAWLDEHKDDKVKRYEVKDWQALFDGKTTRHWKTEGQVSVKDGILRIGGDKGGSIVSSASFARGFARYSYRQAGEAKATITWRGEKHALSPARQGWTSTAYEPDAAGASLIRIDAPPGTTLLIQEFAFRPY
jgi:RNA polymerase sigma factor (sigma-70 family)